MVSECWVHRASLCVVSTGFSQGFLRINGRFYNFGGTCSGFLFASPHPGDRVLGFRV